MWKLQPSPSQTRDLPLYQSPVSDQVNQLHSSWVAALTDSPCTWLTRKSPNTAYLRLVFLSLCIPSTQKSTAPDFYAAFGVREWGKDCSSKATILTSLFLSTGNREPVGRPRFRLSKMQAWRYVQLLRPGEFVIIRRMPACEE